MGILTKCLEFAIKKHEGQVDKSGMPYILHPVTVSLNCKSESAKAVAYLHDVLEDTDATVEDLKELGLSDEIIEAIKTITRQKNETYDMFIKRIALNKIATEVKLADLKHNMDLSRLKEVTQKDIDRVEKYKKAHEFLSMIRIMRGECDD